MKYDVIIVGSGVAGLFCALSLPREKKILVISKDALDGCDSFLAQGGICMLRDDDDYDAYFEDTMRAGHYENRVESVEIMIRSSQEIIKDLEAYGVEFEKRNGEFVFTKEGAHSNNRILFHADITGREITSKLLARAQERENITLMAHTTMVDWVCKDNVCYGIVVADMSQCLPVVVLAVFTHTQPIIAIFLVMLLPWLCITMLNWKTVIMFKFTQPPSIQIRVEEAS